MDIAGNYIVHEFYYDGNLYNIFWIEEQEQYFIAAAMEQSFEGDKGKTLKISMPLEEIEEGEMIQVLCMEIEDLKQMDRQKDRELREVLHAYLIEGKIGPEAP